MKHINLFALFFVILFLFCACEESVPVIGTPSETTEPETTGEPETKPPEPKKRVAFTYDDGPAFDNGTSERLTYRLVDEFAKYGGKATFFIVGNRVNSSTGKAMQYADEHGFEYGIHAFTHEYYFDTCTEQIFLSEIQKTEEAIHKYIDADIRLLRAPGGRITTERASLAGYPAIHWSVDTEDWRHKSRADEETAKTNVNTIVEKTLANIKDGDIILMHEIYENTYEATCIILARLHEMGFEFVTVTELLGEENLKTGETYYSAP